MGNAESYVGQSFNLSSNEYIITRYIGEGGYSFIFQVQDIMTKQPFALKRMLAHDETQLNQMNSEIELMKQMQHPNIVEFHDSGISQVSRQVLIVMEYCPSGHLLHQLQSRGSHYFEETELLRLFRELCRPVEYLHAKSIAHRDLKLENYLLACNNQYKLCDFGSAVKGPVVLETKMDRQAETERVEKTTTALYRAPELADIDGLCLFGSGKIDEKVDIWALGCILYTLAYLKPPFSAQGLRSAQYKIPTHPSYSSIVSNLISRMLVEDPEKRAKINEIVQILNPKPMMELDEFGFPIDLKQKSNIFL